MAAFEERADLNARRQSQIEAESFADVVALRHVAWLWN